MLGVDAMMPSADLKCFGLFRDLEVEVRIMIAYVAMISVNIIVTLIIYDTSFLNSYYSFSYIMHTISVSCRVVTFDTQKMM